VEKWCADNHLLQVKTDANYQLNLEDASNIAGYDIVIFADASKKIFPASASSFKASEKNEFTMHAVSPAYILHLCMQMFQHQPEAYLLHIKGYEWEFMAEMTDRQRKTEFRI